MVLYIHKIWQHFSSALLISKQSGDKNKTPFETVGLTVRTRFRWPHHFQRNSHGQLSFHGVIFETQEVQFDLIKTLTEFRYLIVVK